eukprot:scaffold39328_cov21-Tisochrysis_lutea.AAC.3
MGAKLVEECNLLLLLPATACYGDTWYHVFERKHRLWLLVLVLKQNTLSLRDAKRSKYVVTYVSNNFKKAILSRSNLPPLPAWLCKYQQQGTTSDTEKEKTLPQAKIPATVHALTKERCAS